MIVGRKKLRFISYVLSAFIAASAFVLPVSAAETEKIIIGAAAFHASSDTLTYGDYEYEINDDDTVTITKYSGNDETLIIPHTIDGKTVTQIAWFSFLSCTGLKSITIPDTVLSIGSSAFSGCTGLTSITIPKNVTNIDSGAFANCTNLTSIAVDPDNVNYKSIEGVLYNINITDLIACPGANDTINIPDSVTDIWSRAFSGCANLTSIAIPDSVTHIRRNAFYGCTSLTNVIIPNAVETIPTDAFNDCVGLTSITIPDNVTNIDGGAFSDCTGLKNITLPDSITSIGSSAFSGCTGLSSVVIPNNVKSIDKKTFSGCTGLKSITIPNAVKFIGEEAFAGCVGLSDIYYSGTQEEWGNINISDGNECLTNADFHILLEYSSDTDNTDDRTPFKGTFVFEGGTGHVNVFYTQDYSKADEENVTEAYARDAQTGAIDTDGDGQINFIIVPDDGYVLSDVFVSGDSWYMLKELNNENTYRITKVTGDLSITIKLTEIDDPATKFGWELNDDDTITITSYGGSDEEVIIPDTIEGKRVTGIGYFSFAGNNKMTSVTIPDSVTDLPGCAFEDCTALTKVIIPDSITVIGDNSFYGCESLTNITIPDTVTQIGEYSFCKCTSLTAVTIPKNVTTIGKLAFAECESLTSIVIDPENDNFIAEDGVLYNKDRTELISSYIESGSVEIPNTVTAIYAGAFQGRKGLTEVIIPESVTMIDEKIFSGCESLKSITIPKSVTSIGYNTFKDCASLADVYYDGSESQWSNIYINEGNDVLNKAEIHCSGSLVMDFGYEVEADNTVTITEYSGSETEVAIPDTIDGKKVTSIGHSAFAGCTGLISIEIPDSVTSIGDYAFRECTDLISIEIPDSVTSIGHHAFSDCTGLTSINIPDGVTSIGDFAFQDCTSLTSITIPDGVTSIDEFAFFGCTGLTTITIPDSVTSIGNNSFHNCTNLTSITIPNSVTSIDGYAFVDCTGLTSIEIPDSITNIGESAFSGCTSLSDVYYTGTEEQWNNISIDKGNVYLLNANIITNDSKQDTDNDTDTSTNTDEDTDTSTSTDEDTDTSTSTDEDTDISTNTDENTDTSTSTDEDTDTSTSTDEDTDTSTSTDENTDNNTTEQDFEWYENEDNTVTITKYIGNDAQVNIPDTIDGKSVTNIESYTFNRCTGLTSVTIPESVTNIELNAFFLCVNLTSIDVDTNNKNYTSIDGILYSKNAKTLLVCPGAKDSLEIPSSVTRIYDNAFYGCTSLTHITIPANVINIGNLAFCLCTELTDIAVSPNNNNYTSIEGVLYNKDITTLVACPGAKDGVSVPNSITSIDYGAFAACALTGIELPDNITNIDDYAFYECINLASISLPDSVSSIGKYSFYYCTSLKDVYYRGTEEQLNSVSIDEGNDSLFEANIIIVTDTSTDTDTELPYTDPNDFMYDMQDDGTICILQYNGKNTVVTIPDTINGYTVTNISRRKGSNDDFYANITTVIIPETVTVIDSNAFEGYKGLTSIVIPDSVTVIQDNAFRQCESLTNIVLPNSITKIGTGAFSHCISLNSIVIPKSVQEIEINAFYGCESLLSVAIPDGVTKIGDRTFSGCVSLTDITIPKSVTSIGSNVFSACKSLKDVYYGGSQSDWNRIDNKSSKGFLEEAEIHFSEQDTSDNNAIGKLGDIDGDGKVSAKDSMQIQRYVIKVKVLDDVQLKLADVNGDNKVTNKDSLEILRYTIHLSKNERIGENIGKNMRTCHILQ